VCIAQEGPLPPIAVQAISEAATEWTPTRGGRTLDSNRRLLADSRTHRRYFWFPRKGQEAIVSDRGGGEGKLLEKPSLTGTYAESLRAGRVQEKWTPSAS